MPDQPTTTAEQAAYIKKSSERSRATRDAYGAQDSLFLNQALSDASDDIQTEITSLSGLDTKGAAIQVQRLKQTSKNIDGIINDLNKKFTVFADDAVEGAYLLGLEDGVKDLVDLKIPSYVALAADEIDDLARAVFSVVDTSALDFLTNFRIQLLGDVSEEIRNSIKLSVASGVAVGKSMPDIAKEIGKTIDDPEAFRKAGKTIFKTAQERVDLIARTETNRAHNQGRLKFYEHAGVRQVVWISTLDRRTATLDESYNGQIFDIDKVPPIPLHPRCRCTSAAAAPTRECAFQPSAEAAISDGQGACVMTPDQINNEVDTLSDKDKKKAKDLTIAKQAIAQKQYEQLTTPQMRLAMQERGISFHRTKADKLSLLDAVEPGVDHSGLVGKKLQAALKQYKIGELRTKSEMFSLLQEFDAAVEAATKVVAVSIPDFEGLTVKQLQDEAKKVGVSISKTKPQIIAEMDALNPSPPLPHIMLKGKDFQAAYTKLKINKLKGKQQLIDELTEAFAAANQFKAVKGAAEIVEEGVKLAQAQAVEVEIAKVQKIVDDLALPDNVSEYEKFLTEYKKAWTAVNGADPAVDFTFLFEDFDTLTKIGDQLAVKKAAWDSKFSGLTSNEIKKVAAQAKLAKYQHHNKQETLAKLTSIDEKLLAEVDANVAKKYNHWYYKFGAGKGKKAPPLPETQAPEVVELPAGAPATKAPKPKPETAQPKIKLDEPKPEIPPTPTAPPETAIPVPKPKAPETPPVQKIPETPVPVPDPTKLQPADASFVEVDEAWQKTKSKPGYFKNKRSASVGGAHRKNFYDDPDGQTWLFKPAKKGEEFRAHGDEAAYKIQRLVDPDAPEVRFVEIDGQVGSIQPMLDNLSSKADFSSVAPASLSQIELEQIQREQVVDWLISNHDSHGANYLRGKNGHVYGIDKGQLLKHLGNDKLDIAYHPNGVFGASEPYQHTVMRAWQKGEIELDLQATLKYIKRIEKVSDQDYIAMLQPYVEGRLKGKSQSQIDAFYKLALERKNSIRQEFEVFYNALAKKRGLAGFSFIDTDLAAAPAVPAVKKKAKVEKKPARLTEYEEAMIADASQAKWQGKSIPLDVDEIEDQNILVFTQKVKGKPYNNQTIVTFKVLPNTEKKVFSAIGKEPPKAGAGVTVKPHPLKIGASLAEDKYYFDILAAVKTVGHHSDDLTYNYATVNTATKHRQALYALAKGSNDPEIVAMAKHYSKTLEDLVQKIEDSTKAGKGLKPAPFEQYKRKTVTPEPEKIKPKKAADIDFAVSEEQMSAQLRQNLNGEIVWSGDEVPIGDLFGTSFVDKGLQYRIEFDDGIEAIFRPAKGKANSKYFAINGEVELRIPGRATPDAIESAIEKIEKLGINASRATIEDAEIMYLAKTAYIRNIHNEPRWKDLLKSVKKKSKQEQVQTMRKFWSQELGVDDVTKLPGYEPYGRYQAGTAAAGTPAATENFGRRLQYRFDFDEFDTEIAFKDLSLRHSVTGGNSVADILESAFQHNGAMVSTVEKMRIGVPPGGMSPQADMTSGGASYFFTRLRRRPKPGQVADSGLYFKKDMIKRMDAITYTSDHYGKVTPGFVAKNRVSDAKGIQKIYDQSYYGSDETIFKHTVTIADNVDLIVVASPAERAKVISIFKNNGHAILPDGRKVEDVVRLNQK